MSRVKVKVFRESKMQKIAKQYEAQCRNAVKDGCLRIQRIAVEEIGSGGRTGRKYRRGGKMHTASAAGEYPATDTGNLAQNIFINIDVGGLSGVVESKANYSSFLEFGTSKMAARPFMFPSAERARSFIRKKFRELRAR